MSELLTEAKVEYMPYRELMELVYNNIHIYAPDGDGEISRENTRIIRNEFESRTDDLRNGFSRALGYLEKLSRNLRTFEFLLQKEDVPTDFVLQAIIELQREGIGGLRELKNKAWDLEVQISTDVKANLFGDN